MRAVPGLKDGVALSAACRVLAELFKARGLDSPDADARILVGHALGLDRAGLISDGERILEAREIKAISARAARRLNREPVSRIVGFREFWSLEIRIGPEVLVPRPETEIVVETALDLVAARLNEPLRILDIGTGSGALLLALLSELPNAFGVGTDLSEAALALARDNAVRLELASRSAFLASNVAAALRGPFDLVVSNPPYVASGDIASLQPEVRDYDPAIALDGGVDGLDGYRAISADAFRLLAQDGRLAVELGAGQEATVAALFAASGLTISGRARCDLAGIARALAAARAP